MPPPRPASCDTIYVMYAYGEVAITVCPCWPTSTTNQSSGVRVTLTWATSVPINGLPRQLRPDVRN